MPLLNLLQQVINLRKNTILNRKSKQVNAYVNVESVTAPIIQGGSMPSNTLTLQGNSSPSAGTFNYNSVLLNPSGGKLGINFTPATAANAQPGVVIGSAIASSAPVIDIVSPLASGTTLILVSEAETNNPGVALFSIQVKGSTATPAKQVLLYNPGGDINVSPGTSKAFAIQQNTTTRHQMTTTGVFQFLMGVAMPSTGSKTAGYTVATTDVTVLCDASGGTFNITLPNASTVDTGRIVIIKKTETSANAVGILTGASTQTIDGTDNSVTPNTTLLPASARGCVWLQQTSTTAWAVIAKM